ncbi:MAG: hypothetical protein LM569_05140 [Desulfurococcaceae archaeon]|nr:hypothetical protein [Desulfurococcaceae archaeon]
MTSFSIREAVCCVYLTSTTLPPTGKESPFESTQTTTSPGLWHQLFGDLTVPLVLVVIAMAISVIVLVLEFKVKPSTLIVSEQEYT